MVGLCARVCGLSNDQHWGVYMRHLLGIRQVLSAFIAVVGMSASGGLLAHTASADGKLKIVNVQLKNFHEDLGKLVQSGAEIAGVDYEHNTVQVIMSEDGFKSLPKFAIEGIQGYKEIDIKKAPDAGYRTPAEVEADVKRLAATYPKLVSYESIGKTVENRDIWAVKITSKEDADGGTGKPVVYFNAMHHAREVMTTEVAFDIVENLAKNYASNQKIKNWLDNLEIWVVPQINPDGSNMVWTKNNMWRKNARGGYGIDINRNYTYKWNACSGSSGSRTADDYRGPSAGSEPETQAAMAFAKRIQPVFSISFHSYSELVIYPYGCDGERTATADVVETIGKKLASLLPRDSGGGTYTPGTSWETLYSVDGGDLDYLYHEVGTNPYVIEMNSSSQGFQPAYSRWQAPTVTKLRAAWTYLLDRASESGVRGIVHDSSGAQITGTVTVKGTGASRFTQTLPLKKDGTFHVVLQPGNYAVSIAASGGNSQSRDVMVGSERVDIDFSL